ncbi:uncharacterized protein LOC102896489 isoform X2 [Pteropus alecto]|uniref:uncharacterized protein LOC102896489 isoform X2 n=1 Tax=Pteropus alecto TaxID=9402 RepID=UPI000D53A9C4|nr:uncharacterized protein LOC102896489 isoform X2 [Pteropus alecto]
MASTASFIPSLAERSQHRCSQRTAAIMAIITTPTSLERECQVRDICDTRLTRALPRPPSLLSTADISTEQSRRSPGNPDTASESFSNPGQRKSSPTAEPLELARQMAGVFLAGKRGRIPDQHGRIPPSDNTHALEECSQPLRVLPGHSQALREALLGLGPMCRPPRGPGCATAALAALRPPLKREPRSSGSSVSVHVGPWPLFLGPLVPDSPASTPSKCKPTLQSPHPHLHRLRPLWGAHAPATPHLR